MTCEQAREQFSSWVDEALDPSAREQVAAHLAACSECPRDLDRFTRTVALLAQVERPRAPAGFADRVMGAIGREPWYRRALGWLLGSRPAQLPVSIAATAVIAALSVYLYQQVPELQRAARPEMAPPVERIEPLIPVPVEPGAPARPAEFGPAPPPPSAFRDPAPARPAPRRTPPATGPAAGPAPAPGPPERPAGEAAVARDALQTVPGPQPGSEPAVSKGERPAEDRSSNLGRQRMEPAARAPEPTPERRDAVERPPVPPAPPALRQTRESPAQPSPRPTGAAPSAVPAPAPPAAGEAKKREAERAALAAAGRAQRPPDLVGRLAVTDQAAALAALERLAADLGATSLGRRQDGSFTVVDLMVPRPAYARLEPGLRAIGAWSLEAAPGELPEAVHVTIRVAADRR